MTPEFLAFSFVILIILANWAIHALGDWLFPPPQPHRPRESSARTARKRLIKQKGFQKEINEAIRTPGQGRDWFTARFG